MDTKIGTEMDGSGEENTVVILKIELENFKCHERLIVEPCGKDLFICGRNGVGKTTIADAFLWCLSGEDTRGRSNYGIKPQDAAGNELHHVETVVSTRCRFQDGGVVQFTRNYHELWTKQRGNKSADFTGHTTTYFIDGVPKKASEYTRIVSNFFGDMFLHLVIPTYFLGDGAKWKWTDRRKVLLDICGDISHMDVIRSDSALSELPDILVTHTVEDYMAIVKKTIKSERQILDAVPIRIQEAKRLSVVSCVKPGGDLDELLQSKAEAENALRVARSTTGEMDTRTQIAELKTKLAEWRARIHEIESEERKAESDYSAKCSAIDTQYELSTSQAVATQRSLTARIEILEKSSSEQQEILAKLRKENGRIKAEEFIEVEVGGDCPTCGQVLPIDFIKQEGEKARSEWNEAHAEELKRNREAGVAARSVAEETISQLSELRKQLRAAEEPINLPTYPESIVPNHEERDSLTKQCSAIETRIQKLANQTTSEEAQNPAIARAEGAITLIEEGIAAWASYNAAMEASTVAINRVGELERELRESAERYEGAQSELYLCERYIRTRSEMLDERINGKLGTIQFRLSHTAINGGVEECCDALIRTGSDSAVEYDSASTGEQIRGGLEIIEVLAQHYNMRLPIIIDRCESVSQPLPGSPSQRIYITHNGEQKTLSITTAKTQE